MNTLIFDLDGTLADLVESLEASPIFLSRKMLEGLQGVQFAVVTGGTRREVAFVLDSANVRDLFDPYLIITRDDPFGEKKTGGPFKELLRRIDGEAMVIGDSEADLLGSRCAGLACILLDKKLTEGERVADLASAIQRAYQALFIDLSPRI